MEFVDQPEACGSPTPRPLLRPPRYNFFLGRLISQLFFWSVHELPLCSSRTSTVMARLFVPPRRRLPLQEEPWQTKNVRSRLAVCLPACLARFGGGVASSVGATAARHGTFYPTTLLAGWSSIVLLSVSGCLFLPVCWCPCATEDLTQRLQDRTFTRCNDKQLLVFYD